MDPLETGKFMLMLGGLAGLYLKINQAARAAAGKGEPREITNNPLPVQEASRPATMEDVRLVDHRVSKLEHRLDAHITDSRKATDDLREDVGDLRDRIDDRMTRIDDALRELTRSVGRLEGS